MIAPRCPHCGAIVFMEMQECPSCGLGIGYHYPSRSFVAVADEATIIDGAPWVRCVNWSWQCNWLVSMHDESGRCFACRLVRRRPESDDTISLEKLAETCVDQRRLLVQLLNLRLPVTPYYERDGGLAFDLLSSRSGEPVVIGHASGVITIDLAESLDAHREAMRVRLGEPYRTMLGHFRHEVGHYYQQVLVSSEPLLGQCRDLFGDERESYAAALERHYALGAPEDWADSFISEYATMHPWEDFAETFAHYLHITGTLATAAAAGVVMDS
ncbi:MAG: putative zinc-binding metallopeptidase, partial [Candidatus Nanopelagicales bacterium]|nr:putative zinc-binding metallopeptidase [Candidatus Nanopelagicales bacterium]